jgi:coenzyme Q-binding protein COQ10
MAGATRSIEINAPADVFYDVIADYEKYPEFLSDMETVRVLSQDGPNAQVEFTLNLIKRVSYVLDLRGDPPHGVRWTLARAKMFKHNTGSWEIEELGARRVRATYSIDIGLVMLVPKGISNRLVGKSLPATLESFKRRAESLA